MHLSSFTSKFRSAFYSEKPVDPSYRIALDPILRDGGILPDGVEIHWQSDAPPKVSTALTDFDYFEGRWHDALSLPDVSLLPPEALLRFADVDVNGFGGVRLRNGAVIHSPWLGARGNNWNSQDRPQKVGEIGNPAISISMAANGFGHWFLHRLSRLAMVQRHGNGRQILSTQTFWNPPFMWQGFGIDPESPQYLPKSRVKYFTATDLLIPTFSTPMAFPRVTDSARMRRDVADFTLGIGGERGDGFGPEKIFLPRGNSKSTREGVSEPERLQEIFVKRGFVPVTLSEMSFPDQVRTIRSAHVIAGEVGSFSMNAIFAQPGLGVVTIAANNKLNHRRYEVGMKTFTRTVTDAFEHHQRRIVATHTHRTAPWHVNFDLVENALDSMPEIPEGH